MNRYLFILAIKFGSFEKFTFHEKVFVQEVLDRSFMLGCNSEQNYMMKAGVEPTSD